jgi:hypothetical protein
VWQPAAVRAVGRSQQQRHDAGVSMAATRRMQGEHLGCTATRISNARSVVRMRRPELKGNNNARSQTLIARQRYTEETRTPEAMLWRNGTVPATRNTMEKTNMKSRYETR